jgi:hypothetical protein
MDSANYSESTYKFRSGVRFHLDSEPIFPANGTNWIVSIHFIGFCNSGDQGGTIDMRDTPMTVIFEWDGVKKKDTIVFTTPTS